MQNFPPDLTGLHPKAWQKNITTIGAERGFTKTLDDKHSALFVDAGKTLFVSFENKSAISALSHTNTPFGVDIAAERNWSSLTLLSQGDTWFRAPAVYEFFDMLDDTGFLDRFQKVLFFGQGPAGYAACTYSVTAPGSRVLALQPQATLDPRLTGWDRRFVEQRRLDFTSRYGYAPDMIEAAARAYVLFDPRESEDAMHAALFRQPRVSLYEMPFQGSALQIELKRMGILERLIDAAAEDRLKPADFAKMMRNARRAHTPYLRHLVTYLERSGRDNLAYRMCYSLAQSTKSAWFRRKLDRVEHRHAAE